MVSSTILLLLIFYFFMDTVNAANLFLLYLIVPLTIPGESDLLFSSVQRAHVYTAHAVQKSYVCGDELLERPSGRLWIPDRRDNTQTMKDAR